MADDELVDLVAAVIAYGMQSGQTPDHIARQTISAMREPTLRMCEAGQQVNNIAPESAGLNAFEYLSRDEVAEMWRVMSDEALK